MFVEGREELQIFLKMADITERLLQEARKTIKDKMVAYKFATDFFGKKDDAELVADTLNNYSHQSQKIIDNANRYRYDDVLLEAITYYHHIIQPNNLYDDVTEAVSKCGLYGMVLDEHGMDVSHFFSDTPLSEFERNFNTNTNVGLRRKVYAKIVQGAAMQEIYISHFLNSYQEVQENRINSPNSVSARLQKSFVNWEEGTASSLRTWNFLREVLKLVDLSNIVNDIEKDTSLLV